MSSYVRPTVAQRAYLDADGRVIEYGSRWGPEGPPADSYSRDSHLERFESLHVIADSLIDFLQDTYEVDTTEGLGCATDLLRQPTGVLRALRLTPRVVDAAALTLVFTAYPGLVVHAGLLHDFWFPICGCDACDETAASVADELEWVVLSVVSGGYREEVRGSLEQPITWFRLEAPDGSRSASGSGNAVAESGARSAAASRRLEALHDGWAAWPRRQTPKA